MKRKLGTLVLSLIVVLTASSFAYGAENNVPFENGTAVKHESASDMVVIDSSIPEVDVALALVTFTTSYADSNSPSPEQNGYVYAITPESEQWAEKSVSELYELTNIPIEVYKNMDTADLTQAVIDYPFLGDIYAFNSVEIGISAVSERFSALKELLERPGAETVLQEQYSQIGNTLANTRNIKDLDLDVAMKFRIIGSLLSKTELYQNIEMNDPSKYMSDGSYTHVGNKPTAVGQKMYYPFGANDHSAIVKKLSTTGMFRDIIVTSKWGEYGLYEHSAQECPYFENGAINYPFYK